MSDFPPIDRNLMERDEKIGKQMKKSKVIEGKVDEQTAKLITIEKQTAKLSSIAEQTAKLNTIEKQTAKLNSIEEQTAKLNTIETLTETLDSMKKKLAEINNEETDVLPKEKCSVLMACRIAQIIAVVLFIVSGTWIHDNPCQLKIALKTISLENFPDPCNNPMTETPAFWILGIVMLICNVTLLICLLCIRVDKKCIKVLTAIIICLSSTFTITLVVVSSSFLIYENGKQKNVSYVDLQSSMLSSLETHYKSDEINSTDTFSNGWNQLFILYDCCAVQEVQGTTNDFDNTPWCTSSGSCQATSSQIPRTCCKDVTFTSYQSAAGSCHASVNPGTFKPSCISRMKELSIENVKGYQVTMIFLLSLFLVAVQVADLFLFTTLAKQLCRKASCGKYLDV